MSVVIIGRLRRKRNYFVILMVMAMTLGFSSMCIGHPPPLHFHDPGKLESLKDYYRERLLQIRYVVRNKHTNETFIITGTGFLISGDGYALTAQHVIGYLTNPEFEQVTPVKVKMASGHSFIDLTIVPKTLFWSKKADIAMFKVVTASGQQIGKFLCVRFDDIRENTGGTVTTAAWYFFDDREFGTDFRFSEEARVTSIHGPGPLGEYLELDRSFEKSMSGGPVLKEDRVVGVIAASLKEVASGKDLPGANYVSLIQFADDLNIASRAGRCVPAIPEPNEFKKLYSRQEFMSTEEGTLAWLPNARGQHFALTKGGNYPLLRSDLPCETGGQCNCAAAEERTARFVINHRRSIENKCDSVVDSEYTYYGVQVVPVIKPALRHVTREEVWLFRNVDLYERLADGRFTIIPSKKEAARFRKPLRTFNQAIMDVDDIDGSSGACQGLKFEECAEVLRLQYFKKRVTVWHGFPRTTTAPRSTLSRPAQDWGVPSMWQKEELQVRNWILRYRGTNDDHSELPVNFEFCVASEWAGFYIRVFAPERCVDGPYIRIFVQD